jgi:branched-chain amino acid transport system permease protein
MDESANVEARPARPHRGLLLLLAAPFIGLYPVFVMTALCYAIFACAFNLLLGYTGLLSFGHAAYLSCAAYMTAHVAKEGLRIGNIHLGSWVLPVNLALPPFSPELAVIFGTVLSALLGLVVGAIAIRRQGIYFAMTTLAMAQMVYFVWLQAPFTGGEDGLQGCRAASSSASSTCRTTSPSTTSSPPSSSPSSSPCAGSSTRPSARC